MNILLINHYAGSPRDGMEYRPYYLAREWIRAGHQVRIVAASFSHVRARQPAMPAGGKVLEEVQDGVPYRWLPTPPYVGNGLGRVRNIWAFLWRLWHEAAHLARAPRPDIVIASSTYPMDVWVARRIARLAGAKLIYEVHDLWPASPIELSGMSPRHPFILMCQKAENDAYRDADHVISMLPKVAAHMQSHGLDLRKLAIVPNGVAMEEWEGEPVPLAPAPASVLTALRERGRTLVGYAGSHGLPNALDVLLDAAALLRESAFTFVLFGDGHEKARLARRVEVEQLANVLMLPPVPKAQVRALLAEFDLAYIGWQRVPIYRFGIAPNKLLDYMMAGRPVLHSVAAGNDPVAEANCGLTVEPESPAAVAAGLLALANRSAEERAAMGARGRAFVVAHHTYRVLAQRFVEVVTAP